MTEILINKLKYKHFKGLEDFELTLNGTSAVISGRNGLGKTTLADGLQWLFFGKDSTGAKINPKPRDKKNQEYLGLEPTIEAELIIDGKVTVLKRIQEEKWTTKKGEIEKTRGNDTTKYFIDSVPKKEAEWKDYLELLGGEASLQMLSNSSFFMSLNWNKRREILIDFTGLTDQQIIDSDSELKEINSFLDGHSIDEMKKILKGRKSEIKQKIDGMPARIQEVTDMKTNLNIGDRTQLAIQKDIDEITQLISEKESWLVDAKTGAVNTELVDLKQKQADLKVKLADQRAIFLTNANTATATLNEDLNKQQKTVNLLRSKVNELESSEYRTDQAIQEKTDFLDKHLEKYKELKAIEFDENRTTCPTCGQDLPAEEAEQMRLDFNQRKATDLEQNIALGKATRQDKEKLLIEIESIKKDLATARMELKSASDRLDLINNDLIYEQKRNGEFEDSQVYRDINAELSQTEIAIERAANKDSSAEVEKLTSDIQSDKTILAGLNQELQKFEMVKTYDDRLAVLKEQDKDLKNQNQEVEKQLWLMEEFTRRKVKRIEESINERFSIVKWKLFDVQKNEGIKEMCEATYNGIEYSSGLNNGARINCDLDIIRTLSRELGVTMPVFVDNAESVNTLQPIEGQMIELQVTEDENLKVEVRP
ncbi:AAA family ATPase [Enterococcus hulanensis]|uniref:AAA family ATPase n=1 Tax=Enterococcus hulanensis TaxID=2559929 RepID=UPI001A8FB45B|nr:AAA family ATPase [Enterococcus hulanensis]MBO0456324.1 AAA family ATPase [Enterococcus hulanensis]